MALTHRRTSVPLLDAKRWNEKSLTALSMTALNANFKYFIFDFFENLFY
jgi:hypothetical protein